MNNKKNTRYPFKDSRKPLIIAVASAVAITGIVIYGIAAYNTPLWPFSATTQETEGSKSFSKESVKTSFRSDTRVTESEGMKVLRVVPVVDTQEKGDCTLTLTKGEDTYTFSNSTKDVKGLSGCLEWNVNVTDYKEGAYTALVTFEGERTKSTHSELITIK